MNTPIWDAPKDVGPLEGSARDATLAELCDHHQTFILATPYLSFESRFLERQGNRLKVRATMGQDTVKHALTKQALRIRFPWALSFYAGATEVVSYEPDGNRRALILTVPQLLTPDEPRRAMRMNRVGNSTGAVGDSELHLVRMNLENVSTLGAGLSAREMLPAEGFQAGHTVEVSLSLDDGPSFHTQGRIQHRLDRFLGLSFNPPLERKTLDRLIAWLEPRREEAWYRWENRTQFAAKEILAAQPKLDPSGILVVTKDPGMVENIAFLVGEDWPVRSVLPALAPFKETMNQPPFLLIVHLSGEGVDERHRVKTLLECADSQCPRLILGNGHEPDLGRQLAVDVRAGVYWDWDPNQVVFFKRLVKGIIQKRWGSAAQAGNNPKP